MTKPSARQERILAILRSRGPARVAELAREFDVSPITLRRDVEALARREHVVRGHGIVRLPSSRRDDRERPATGVVVVMAPPRSAYLAQIVEGARQAVEELGLHWHLEGIGERETAGSAVRRAAAVPAALGTLVFPRWRTTEAVEAEDDEPSPGAPAVLVERFAPVGSVLADLDAVRTDHSRGVLLALRHLRERGHARILLVARNDSPTARTIRTAFAAHLAGLGLPQLTEPLLSSAGAGPDPDTPVPHVPAVVRATGATAVVAHSDVDALNMVQQLHTAGLRVPDDVSVVAYDDVIAGLGGLELTTVAPPKRGAGIGEVST
ncbi:substrate-binding domain-containing protein [Pseudonocardia sp. DLS-67]